MRLRVLGCHGGTSRDHRSVSLLVDDTLALDGGSLASGLDLEEQARLRTVLITHPHIDHIAEVGTVCDARAHRELAPLRIVGLESTLDALRAHYFNDVLWPDFSRIEGPSGPVCAFDVLALEQEVALDDFVVRAVSVEHTVPTCGFVVRAGEAVLAYSGDTGPTHRFWECLNELPRLDVLVTEVSFPDALADLALRSGHLTPASLATELAKLEAHERTPVLLYGLKPAFEAEIRRELAELDVARMRVLEEGEVVSVGQA